MQAEVQPLAGPQQILNFFVGFGTAKSLIERSEHYFGDAQTEHTRQFAGNQFGNQGLGPLPRPPKFQDVQEIVVGFDDGGQ